MQGFLAWVADQRLPGDVTEGEWLASTDVEGMVDWLRKTDLGLSENGGRRFRLFDCACCRRIWPLMPDDRCRRAVEVSEQYADGRVDDVDLSAAPPGRQGGGQRHTEGGPTNTRPAGYAAWAAVYSAWQTPTASAAYNTRTAVYFTADLGVEAAGSNTRHRSPSSETSSVTRSGRSPSPALALRRPSSTWLGESTTRLRSTCWRDLADRFEEAGCVHLGVLDHCRGPGPHARGCRALDLLLGKE